MAVFKNDITLDATQAKQELQDMTREAKTSGDAMKNNGKGASDMAKNINQAAANATNYRKKLSQLQRQIVDLTVNYRNLSDAEKNSAAGKELATKIQDMTAKAGEWRDAIGDVRDAIKALASDTHLWDAASLGLDIVKSGMESFLTITMGSKKGTEEFQNAMMKLAQVETGFNTVIKITNALQKSSALMQGIMTIKTKLLTAETGKLTLAQRAFNVVAKANPYVLLATAIVAAGAAIYAFISSTNDATEEEKRNAEATKRMKESMEEYRSEAATTAANLMSNYDKLKDEWKRLKTEHEKTEWLKNNISKFDEFGATINDTADAEKFFNMQTEQFKKAMELRARYIALATVRMKAYEEYYKKLLNASGTVKGGGYYTKYDPNSKKEGNRKTSIEEARAAGVEIKTRMSSKPMAMNGMAGGIMNTEEYFENTKENIDKINAYRNKKGLETNNKIRENVEKELKKVLDFTDKEAKTLKNEFDALGTNLNFNNTKNKLKEDKKTDKKDTSKLSVEKQGRYDELVKEISDAEKKLNNKAADKLSLDDTRKKLKSLKDEKFELDFEIDFGGKNTVEALIIRLGHEIEDMKEFDIPLAANEEDVKKIQDDIDKKVSQMKKLKLEFDFDREGFNEEWDNVLNEHKDDFIPLDVLFKSNYQSPDMSEYDIQIQNYDESLQQISTDYNNITNQLKALLKLLDDATNAGVGISDEQSKTLEELNSKLILLAESYRELQKAKDGVMTANDFVVPGSLDDYNKKLNELYEKLNKVKIGSDEYNSIQQKITDTEEKQLALIGKAAKNISTKEKKMKKMEDITDSVNSLGDAFSALGSMTEDTGLNVAGVIAQTIAQLALSTSKAIALASELGPWGWVAFGTAAMALLAGMVAQIHSITGYAEGGIVNSGSFIGDKNLIRVNGNEMVLNTALQERLFGILNGKNNYLNNISEGGSVEFVIKGENLVGVQKNYNNRKSLIKR